MRVHLITAESPESRRLRRGRLIQFPQLTMPLIAALTPREYVVSHTDEIVELVRFDVPADLVAITAATLSAPHAYRLASIFRRRGVPVVIGGPHATHEAEIYPARLQIDYPVALDRTTTLLRMLWTIPIGIILSLITTAGGTGVVAQTVETARFSGGSVLGGLAVATALMIVFRQHYPRWWFDFARELVRFSARVGAYAALLTDVYPSTVDEQAVHLEIDYPDVRRELNRWLPLVKWLLAVPHYVVLALLAVGAIAAVVVAWFAILLTGRYPRGIFDFVVGVGRWGLRVQAYASLLVTDRYPPFTLA